MESRPLPELVQRALEEEALANALEQLGSDRAFTHKLTAYGFANLAGASAARTGEPRPAAIRRSNLLDVAWLTGRAQAPT